MTTQLLTKMQERTQRLHDKWSADGNMKYIFVKPSVRHSSGSMVLAIPLTQAQYNAFYDLLPYTGHYTGRVYSEELNNVALRGLEVPSAVVYVEQMTPADDLLSVEEMRGLVTMPMDDVGEVAI